MDHAARFGRVAALALLLAIGALLMVEPVLTIPARVAKNYNEGWNAYQAAHAFGPEPLYPDPSALIANNYPPLSFYLVGVLGTIAGDHIVAGRWVSLASFLAVALAVGYVAGRLSQSARLGFASSALFVGTMTTFQPEYLGMNDPQWLAQAVQSVALVVLLTRPVSPSRLRLVLVLTLFAGLIKHNLVSLPIALTLQLLVHDRRQAWRWLKGSALALALCLSALYLVYGQNFFLDVLCNARSYALADFWQRARLWLPPLVPLGLAFLAFARLEPASPRKTLLLLYVAVSAGIGAGVLGGAGINRNVLVDLIIGLSIAAGLAIPRISERFDTIQNRAAIETGAILVFALGILLAAPGRLSKAQESLATLEVRESRVAADIGVLAGVSGAVACENLALCYWAGKPFEMDLFDLGQKLRSGRFSNEAFTQLIESRRFSVIQMDGPGKSRRLSSAARRTIARSYEARRNESGGVFLLPRHPSVAGLQL